MNVVTLNFFVFLQICPGLNANEIQILYDNHHKVSSLVKRHQNTVTQLRQIWSNMKMSDNPAQHEVLFKQYLHWILDISEILRTLAIWVSDSQIYLPSVIFAPQEEYLPPKNDSRIMHFFRPSLPFCVELSCSGPILRHFISNTRSSLRINVLTSFFSSAQFWKSLENFLHFHSFNWKTAKRSADTMAFMYIP